MSERESIEIRGSLDPEQLVFRQMDRINQATIDEDENIHDRLVLGLMDNLPPHKLKEVLEREKEYITNTEEWIYDYHGSTPLGTPEKQVLGSPRLETVETWDYRKLRQIINEVFQDAGVFWKVEQINEEKGFYKEEKGQPTPVFNGKKKL